MRRRSAILTALIWTPIVLAQPDLGDDPGDDPELVRNPEDREAPARDATRSPEVVRPVQAPVFEPARPHQPEPDIDAIAAPSRLLPEGSFIVDQPGYLGTTPGGAWVFTPQTEPGEPRIRPIVMLPSQILGRLRRIAGDDAGNAAARLTGRVTLYHDQNYMLLTAIGGENELPEQPDAQDETPEPGAPDDALSSEVESIIEQLEAERTGVRSVISGLGSGDETAVAPVAEGRVISRRRGRFVRLDAGELAISFDNDDAESPIDSPLVVAPCSLLEAVEESLEIHGDSVTATVSGQTLAFAGRSFLLPISIVLERPSDLSTRQ